MPRANTSIQALHDIANLQNRYCKDCDKAFARPADYKRHLNTTLKHNPAALQYVCQYCARPFTQKSNLAIHERIHNGDQAEHCGLPSENEICGHQCSDPGSMRRHINKVHFAPYKNSSQPIPVWLQVANEKRQQARREARIGRRPTKARELPACKPTTRAMRLSHKPTPSSNTQVPIPSHEIPALFREYQYPTLQMSELPQQLLQVANVHLMGSNGPDAIHVGARPPVDLPGWSKTTRSCSTPEFGLELGYSDGRGAEVPPPVPEQTMVAQGLDTFSTGNHPFCSDFYTGFPALGQQDQVFSEPLNLGAFTPLIRHSSGEINIFPDVSSGAFPELFNSQSAFDGQLAGNSQFVANNGDAGDVAAPFDDFTLLCQQFQQVHMDFYNPSCLPSIYPTEHCLPTYNPTNVGCFDALLSAS